MLAHDRDTIVIPYNAVNALKAVIGDVASFVDPEEEVKGDQPDVSITNMKKGR